MVDFFKLTTQYNEDKVVSKQYRIYGDFIIGNDTPITQTVNTTSKAPFLKISFFIDGVGYGGKVYKLGRYVELENYGELTFINSTILDSTLQQYSIRYSCSENNNGNFVFTLTASSGYTFYITAIAFVDSFFNNELAWLNPANPSNIVNDINIEPIDTVLPFGGNEGDTLENFKSSSANWISKQTFYDRGPKSGVNNWGTVKPDNSTIKSNNGVLSSGVNYSLVEQNTGYLWYNGKTIYQQTFINLNINGQILLTNVDQLITHYGTHLVSSAQYPVPTNDGTNWVYLFKNNTNGVQVAFQGFGNMQQVTVLYTKL